MASAWIGTSGFNYEHWQGVLYPEDLPRRQWFDRYMERFNAVELNVTFYRLPKPDAVDGWAERAPAGFRFVAKGSRFITHMKRLKDPEEPLQRFFDVVGHLGERLRCVLWQLRPDHKADAERLGTFMDALEDAPAPRGVRHAFEFRHASWFDDEALEEVVSRGHAVALADQPFQVLERGMRRRNIQGDVVRVPDGADWVFVRRHGPGARYRSGYPDSMIASDARWTKRWLDEGRDVFAFYNNDVGGHAVRDATALRQRVAA